MHSAGRPSWGRRGQTILEYILVVVVVMIPLAIAVRGALEDSNEENQDNLFRTVVRDAYGDETRMGIIGRPYP